MQDYDSLNHTKWECKYHIVRIPKYRRKSLYGKIRAYLGEEIRRLAVRKGSEILGGHIMPDYIHILIKIPPKYSVPQVVGYVKGESAIYVARRFGERKKYFNGQEFLAAGGGVSTVGLDEEKVKKYIKEQERSDAQLDLMTT